MTPAGATEAQAALRTVVVIGARGRLGALVCAAAAAEGIRVVPVGRGDDLATQLATQDRGGCVVIDVSTAGATAAHARACASAGLALVVGTTGLTREDEAALDEASALSPVVATANLSVSAHIVAATVLQLARALPGHDVEVVELHHNKKKDAPSGTALLLARAAAEGRASADHAVANPVVTGRAGHGPRNAGEIGVAAVRGGDVVGEHTVFFLGAGERVEIAHRITDRAIFARGALTVARELILRTPGRYAMADLVTDR